MTPEQFSRVYALLGDRTRRPDGDEWDHDSLGRLVRDINATCPGFTTPRAKPEPVPDPPLRVATDEARRRYIAQALANVEQVRRELRGSK